MLEYISDLRLFSVISRTLNFREAGEKLGYSPAVVTMRIKRLEAVTGKTLFIRSTRHIKMTEEGHELLKIAENMLDLSELMSAPARPNNQEIDLKGTVRITSPHSFARAWLLEPIKQIVLEHPELSIDLLLEDSLTSLIKEGIDISFRVGGAEETNMESTNLMPDQRIAVASPAYLKQHGTPEKITDLKEHRCLTFSGLKQWSFHRKGQVTKIALQNPLFCNTGDYLTRLAAAGTGITIKSDWSVKEELESGELVRVLPEYTAGPNQFVRALMPRRDYTPTRVGYVLNRIASVINEAS